MTIHQTGGAPFTRRGLLIGMAALGLAACMPRGTGTSGRVVHGIPDPLPADGLPDGVFTLGVASGDPAPDGMVLWTRLAPAPLASDGGMPEDLGVPIRWQLASDPGFSTLIADGIVTTSSVVAHSVHITVTGLDPDTEYWYRFTTGGQVSAVGRTRTAPAPGAPVEHARIVAATCQHYEQGFYTAWSHVAADQPDLVVFLGDYIYEGGISSGRPRQHNSPAITTLEAYRARYGLYKSDPRLQAAHAAAPWVVTWDDHEVQNNYAGQQPPLGGNPATFLARRAAAYQAYWEHQPVRSTVVDGGLRLHRSLRWGSLFDLHMLDERQYRSQVPCGVSVGPDCPERSDPARSILGAEQRAWLLDELAADQGRWTLVGNPTIMSPMQIGTAFNLDQWDGYAHDQGVVIDGLAPRRNAVVLTGDFHAGGVFDLRRAEPGAATVGTELVSSSISSTPDPTQAQILNQVINALPQVQWFETTKRGYTRIDLTPDHLDADFLTVATTTDVLSPAVLETAWRITDGQPGAVAR